MNVGFGVTGVSSSEDCSNLSNVAKMMAKTRLARACDMASFGSQNITANTRVASTEDYQYVPSRELKDIHYHYLVSQSTSGSEAGAQRGQSHPASDRPDIRS